MTMLEGQLLTGLSFLSVSTPQPFLFAYPLAHQNLVETVNRYAGDYLRPDTLALSGYSLSAFILAGS